MGIQGLLPLLKSIHKPTHLRDFSGQTLGVDAYGWLHRGTVACAIELAQDKPTRRHIDFAISRVRMLLYFGVKPYIVFDGDYLPSKAHTEKDRAARRKESRRLGLELLRTGRTSMAQVELQKAVDVTPLMARELIEELKRLGVPYVVAPYEADSELAYLEKKGIISGIISEDSDLLVFGAQRLLTKLDQHGDCIMIRREDFTACRDVSLVGWSDAEFRTMTMLSGCDYLPGIERMGLKTAYRLVRKHRAVEKVVRTIQFEGKMKVPPGYLESFSRAERTFLYQWVYCPEQQRLVNLNPLPSGLDVTTMPYIGKDVDAEIAVGVASGELDPNTKEKIILKPKALNSSITRALQTPDAKPGKPITDFFRSRRTPLAELDPNSFTPSPSQRSLLISQQNVTWSASVANEPRSNLAATTPRMQIPMSAPQPTRRAVSDLWASVRSQETSKRPRLCEDTSLAASISGSHGIMTSSPFFSKSSPTAHRSGPRKSHDDFELWSDDTFAEAEALASASVSASTNLRNSSVKKRKKVAVFADAATGDLETCTTQDESELASSHIEETQASSVDSSDSRTTPSTVATSQSDTQPAATSDVFGPGVQANFAAFKAKFAFTSSTKAPAPESLVAPRVESHTNEDAAITLDAITGTPPSLAKGKPSSKIPWSDLKVTPPASPRLEVQGSEDMLVPQSSPVIDHEEDLGAAQNEDTATMPPQLNLSRFIFSTAG